MNRYECESIHHAFSKGWHDAALGGAYETARETLIGSPEYTSLEVDAYLNGAEDGRLNERMRLDGHCALCNRRPA